MSVRYPRGDRQPVTADPSPLNSTHAAAATNAAAGVVTLLAPNDGSAWAIEGVFISTGGNTAALTAHTLSIVSGALSLTINLGLYGANAGNFSAFIPCAVKGQANTNMTITYTTTGTAASGGMVVIGAKTDNTGT